MTAGERRQTLNAIAQSGDGFVVTAAGVAVIDLIGPMMRNPGGFACLMGFAGSRQIAASVSLAAMDPDVKSIVLRIDSPGGAVDGTPELASAVRAARDVKPIIAQIDGIATSAAYWVASQATQIIASQPLDLVASIGVRMAIVDISEANKRDGVRVEIIDTGELKSTGDPNRAITEADIQHVQSLVDEAFSHFASAVREGRSMSEADFKLVSDGRIMFAESGLVSGLIDEIQPMSVTIGDLTGSTQAARRSARSRRTTASAAADSMRMRRETDILPV